MGGYNTVCEVLSFQKQALIVPRVRPRSEQWIRAERLRDLQLIDVILVLRAFARKEREQRAMPSGPERG